MPQPKAPEWDAKMPMTQNLDGRWVPDIPEPFHSGYRKTCPSCKKKFWNIVRYRGHYALAHILRLKDMPG